MTGKFHFNSMREPLRDLIPGTPKWNEGYSAWLQSEFGRTETQGVSRVIEVLHHLLPHKPWNDVPLDKPCKRADVYFEGVTGKPWKVLVSLVQEYDPELAAEIQSYVHPENPGRPKDDGDITNNISNYEEPKQHGTSKAYTLNRLRRDHGELFEKVKAGEMTANAAAIEAGFRKKLTPFQQVMALLPKLTEAERDQLRRAA